MYHYVRPNSQQMPHFRYLHFDDFCKQLDYFTEEVGFVSKHQFLDSLDTGDVPSGIVLTFDDGLRDHYSYVLPELCRRGLWGIFYIPAGPYLTGRMLDVHRIHMLLGAFGGKKVLQEMQELILDEMLTDAQREEFRTKTYALQDNDSTTTLVKRTLNYFVSPRHQGSILDELMRRLLGGAQEGCERHYMLSEQIADLQRNGMIVGSHSCTHPVFSKLSEAEQYGELAHSFGYLDNITGGLAPKTFCYPYGGFHSFTNATERLLAELGCRFAFNVEPRDIERKDLICRPQALPRYDCNQFEHGRARMGDIIQ